MYQRVKYRVQNTKHCLKSCFPDIFYSALTDQSYLDDPGLGRTQRRLTSKDIGSGDSDRNEGRAKWGDTLS